MNGLPSIREKTRDVDPVGSPQGVFLATYEFDRVPSVSMKCSQLQKTERGVSAVIFRLH